MPETKTVDLSSRIKPFDLLTAEWWDENSKCVVVRGSMNKDHEDFALRLDLDKRAFLDHAENADMDKLVQGQASLISQLVWKARSKGTGEDPAPEGGYDRVAR
jgi:hypothetical protein